MGAVRGTGEAISHDDGWRPLSRRGFLTGASGLALGAALWSPAFRIPAAAAQSACAPPPGFPASIDLYQQAWQNWSEGIAVDGLWTCAPKSADEVVAVVNWALGHGYRVRPRGMMHTWTPFTVLAGTTCSEKVVLVDLTQHLSAIEVISSEPAAVRAQTGATMDQLLGVLEGHGLGVTACPTVGDVTIGGVLAVDGHGASVPARGESPTAGHTYGSLSNLILSFTAVVWDASRGRYDLRTFDRSEPAARAFLTHVGRALLTEVTLRVGANNNLRCVSRVDIPASTLFAAPRAGGEESFASFVEESGRVEAVWYPFTTNPWLKVWSVSPSQPALSRVVTAPYNYVFSDEIPKPLADLAAALVKGNRAAAPTFGQLSYDVTAAGLAATASSDLWGASKNLLLWVKPTTLRTQNNGYAVLCRRADVQRVVSEFAAFFEARLLAYQAQGRYPIAMPVEIRVTGLDHPADVGASPSASPVLSALRPRPDQPRWDVAVWIDVLTFFGMPDSNAFYRDVEQWFFSNYSSYAAVRPEWAKAWGFTNDGAWTDRAVIGTTIPAAYRAGRRSGDDWDFAVSTLDAHDPHRIFTNSFINTLMPPVASSPAPQRPRRAKHHRRRQRHRRVRSR
jgi:FAD/FMN-containing dehydrogenase